MNNSEELLILVLLYVNNISCSYLLPNVSAFSWMLLLCILKFSYRTPYIAFDQTRLRNCSVILKPFPILNTNMHTLLKANANEKCLCEKTLLSWSPPISLKFSAITVTYHLSWMLQIHDQPSFVFEQIFLKSKFFSPYARY